MRCTPPSAASSSLAVTISATLAAGTALAFFTFGIAEAAAAATTATLIAAAEAIGLELSATVAMIVAGGLVGAAFGAVEGFAVDVAVAQPIRVWGYGEGGFSMDEAKDVAVGGAIVGGVFGLGTGGLRALRLARLPAAETAPAALVRSVAPTEADRAIFDELHFRTFASNREHALVRLESGERVIVAGGHTGIELFPVRGQEVTELLAHGKSVRRPGIRTVGTGLRGDSQLRPGQFGAARARPRDRVLRRERPAAAPGCSTRMP